MKVSGTVSARMSGDSLAVRCACGLEFSVSATGGEHTCRCGMVHRYDGKTLVSVPGGPGPGIGNPGLRPAPPDPRRQRPTRESNPL